MSTRTGRGLRATSRAGSEAEAEDMVERAPQQLLRDDAEQGRITILAMGMVAVVVTLVLGVVGLTAVQISRIQLLDAADAAALDASDAIDESAAYGGGVGHGIPLTDQTVIDAVHQHLGIRPQPSRISQWWIAPGTGSPDGRSAVVVLQGEAEIPVVSSILRSFGGSVTITVATSARSDLD